MYRRKQMLLVVALFIVGTVPHFANAQKKLKGKVIVPAWKIQIVDEAGNPVKDVFVRQFWQDYDIEDDSHLGEARSDENGYVSFPERREKSVSKLARAKKRLKNRVELGVHAGFGVDDHIYAWGEIAGCKRLEGDVQYDESKPLLTRLQMHFVKLPGCKCTS